MLQQINMTRDAMVLLCRQCTVNELISNRMSRKFGCSVLLDCLTTGAKHEFRLDLFCGTGHVHALCTLLYHLFYQFLSSHLLASLVYYVKTCQALNVCGKVQHESFGAYIST